MDDVIWDGDHVAVVLPSVVEEAGDVVWWQGKLQEAFRGVKFTVVTIPEAAPRVLFVYRGSRFS